MSGDVVRPEEVRAWAESRGFTINRRGNLPAALIKGWNKVHPDRTYKPFQHGTAGRGSIGCPCDPCRDAYSAYQRDYRYSKADPT